MAGCAARWLAVAAALCACDGALADVVTWPGCPKQLYYVDRVVTPGVADQEATYLHLSSCNLTSLALKQKLEYSHLWSLYLNQNKLESLPTGIFDSFVSLFELNLGYTSLSGKDLDSSILRNCIKLTLLYFDGNNMTEAPADLLQGLDQLEGLSCESCSLHQMPSFITHPVLPKMKTILLRNNQLSGLNARTFSNVANLKELYLNYNKIDYLHEDLFKNLTKLEFIYMDFNKIRYIPEKLFQNKPSLRILNLSNNLIDYIPERAFEGLKLARLELNNNRLTNLPDNFFNGVTLEHFHFVDNPWSCTSFQKLLIKIKKLKIEYDGEN